MGLIINRGLVSVQYRSLMVLIHLDLL